MKKLKLGIVFELLTRVMTTITSTWTTVSFASEINQTDKYLNTYAEDEKRMDQAIEKQIIKHLGLSLGSYISTALNIIGSISQVSLGYAVAWSIDYVDGRRLDGYIFA